MQVESPYGKNISIELKTIYGFESVESAVKFIERHVKQNYQLLDISIETLHIAYGLAAKIRTRDEIYYLKFASRSMHDNPEQLFPWLDYARKQGIPLPEIIPSLNGSWYLSPLENVDSDYDVVYLMRGVGGKPMHQTSASLLRQYAETMAHFHHIGLEYPHPILGSDATWNSKWKNRHNLWHKLKDSTLISLDLTTQAMQLIEETGLQTLPKTILHGDFRWCHVFFQDNTLSGIIDVDQSSQGERFIDLCYGLVSSSFPEGGSLLKFDELQYALSVYHECLPLSEVDKSILRATFAYAILETLSDICEFVLTRKSTVQGIYSTQKLLQAVIDISNEELVTNL
jgi:Ser/Thr protein kinase RdoA (MazF antagonist)